MGGVNPDLVHNSERAVLFFLSGSFSFIKKAFDCHQFALYRIELVSVDFRLLLLDPDRGKVVCFTDQFFGAGDRISLLVQQVLDHQDELDVLAPIESLLGAGTLWLDGGKLAFPVAQDMGCDVGEFADFAYLEI